MGASFLDLIGLGLIAPYISLVMNPTNVGSGILAEISHTLGLNPSQDMLLIVFGIGLVFIFLIKAFGNLLIQYNIITFSLHQQVRLRTNLMRVYQEMPYDKYLSRNSSEYIHGVQNLVTSFGSVLYTLLKTISDGLIAGMIILILAWQNPWILCTLLVLLGSLIMIRIDYF